MKLTKYQQAQVDAAAEILAAEHGYDAMELADHCGRLGWHLKEMLALITDLTDPAR
jgi:hypothetical protein